MAIDISRYVDITSGVGGGAAVTERALIGRLFTDSNLLPPDTYLEFANAAAVGAYFGTSSEEYNRALFYFGWVSKNITTPQTISYARFVGVASTPTIYGIALTTPLTTFQGISDGSFGLTQGLQVETFTNLNFSTVTSFADVATVLQTAIRAVGGPNWATANVVYDALTNSFEFTGGAAGANALSVQAGAVGTDISRDIGWLPAATYTNGVFTPGAITVSGSAAEDVATSLTNSANLSNNFGSFLFCNNCNLTLTQIVEAANWNQTQNFLYMYTVAGTTADMTSANPTYPSQLASIGGVGLTLNNISTEYPEMAPMMILAATDYSSVNSVQNYMFQQFNLTPSVTNDADANIYDNLSVNYYGQTQTAGQFLSFYQRGVLQGLSTSALDMNTYANEQWLKNAVSTAVLNLLMALSQVSANTQGNLQVLTILQSVINQALSNGTISVGKPLTTTQQLYITQITGDAKAWYQVQTIGYWVDCVIVPYGSNPVQYKAEYTLVYSKDDVIRLVTGTDVLI